MNARNFAQKLNMKTVTAGNLEKEIKDCYICDMLSYVMTKAKEGDAWITIQTNVNVVAVASLSECACVIIPEDIHIEETTIKKAEDQGINIFSSQLTAFEIAVEIGKSLGK